MGIVTSDRLILDRPLRPTEDRCFYAYKINDDKIYDYGKDNHGMGVGISACQPV